MQKDFDVFGDIRSGKLSRITEWLRERIHRFGCYKKPDELLCSVIGELDPDVYCDYLLEKLEKNMPLKA